MRTLAILTAFLYLSCSVEPISTEDIVEQQKGYLMPEGAFYLPETSKDVPGCSAKTPENIVYIFTNEIGNVETKQSPITFNGDTFTVVEPIELNIGTYTVTDVFLVSADGTTTYSVPNVIDPRFDFAAFVDNPTPYNVTIVPDGTTADALEMMCYTASQIAWFGEFSWPPGTVHEFVSLLLFVHEGNCIDTISIQVEGGNEIFMLVNPGQPHVPPVPKLESFTIRSYSQGDLIQTIGPISDYNADGVFTDDDVISIENDCD